MIATDRKVELWLIAAAVLIAVATGAAALIVSLQSKRISEDTLRATQVSAWDYGGAQNCASYRDQVFNLWDKGVPAEQIRKWFEGEAGGAQNPYTKSTDGQTAADDLESGCGSVKSLVSILEAKK